MAAKKSTDNLTFAVAEPVAEKRKMVPVFLPEILGSDGDMKVDQYEHVTIANENGEKQYHVKRGVHTEIPVEAFIVLKERYPNL